MDPGQPTQPTTRQRAGRRTRITLVTLSAFLALAVVVAVLFAERMIGTGQPVAQPTTVCTAGPAPPSRVTVNVYNATDKDGLAKAVAKNLASQGFRIAGVGNDPKGTRIVGVAQVRHGASASLEAQSVAARFPGAQLVRDARTDTIVDVAIGEAYRRMATPPPTPVTPTC